MSLGVRKRMSEGKMGASLESLADKNRGASGESDGEKKEEERRRNL